MSTIPDFFSADLKTVNQTLLDCLVTTSRVQADHELEGNQVKDLDS
jgi:hypothetical protein